MSEDTQAENVSLEEHVQAEIDSARKSFRYSLIAFAIIAVVFIGYFQWLKGQMNVILDPPMLAKTLVNESVRIFPLLQPELEKSLTSTIPRIAQEVMDITVEESVPAMRARAVKEFNKYSDELLATGSAATTEAFKQILISHKAEFVKASESPSGTVTNRPPSLSNLDRLIDREITQCRRALKCQKISDKKKRAKDKTCANFSEDIKTCTSMGYKEDAAQSLESSQASLANINARLKGDAENRQQDRKSVLTFKLVRAWYSMVQSGESPSRGAAEGHWGLQPKTRGQLK